MSTYEIYDGATSVPTHTRRVSVAAVLDDNGDPHLAIENPDGTVSIYHSRSNLGGFCSPDSDPPPPPPVPPQPHDSTAEAEIAKILRNEMQASTAQQPEKLPQQEAQALISPSSPQKSSSLISTTFNYQSAKSSVSPRLGARVMNRSLVPSQAPYLQQPSTPSAAHVVSFTAQESSNSDSDSDAEPPAPPLSPAQQSQQNNPLPPIPSVPQSSPSPSMNSLSPVPLPQIPPIPTSSPQSQVKQLSPQQQNLPVIRSYFDDNSDDDDDAHGPMSPGQSFLIVPGTGPLGARPGMNPKATQKTSQMKANMISEDGDECDGSDQDQVDPTGLVHSYSESTGELYGGDGQVIPSGNANAPPMAQKLPPPLLAPMHSEENPPTPPPQITPRRTTKPNIGALLAPLADSDDGDLPPPPTTPRTRGGSELPNSIPTPTTQPSRTIRAPPALKQGGGYELNLETNTSFDYTNQTSPPVSTPPISPRQQIPPLPPVPPLSPMPPRSQRMSIAPPPIPASISRSLGSPQHPFPHHHQEDSLSDLPSFGGPPPPMNRQATSTTSRVGDTALFFNRLGSPTVTSTTLNSSFAPPTATPSGVNSSGSCPPFSHGTSHSSGSKPVADLTSVGKLNIHPSTPSQALQPPAPPPTSKKGKGHITAGPIQEVRRVAHFTFDPETGQYSDVPPEWRVELSKKFGIPLPLCATEPVDGYPGRLPPVLLFLKKWLIELGGINQVGIFRLAPEGQAVNDTKTALNNNSFQDCDDVNVMAHLIKVWFRELPVQLLDYVKDKNAFLTLPDSVEATGKFITDNFEEPQLSLWYWLLDLCNDVADNASVNKMAIPNMGIVVAPNLYKPPDATSDGALAMRLCKRYTSFCEKAIQWRLTTTGKDNRPRGY